MIAALARALAAYVVVGVPIGLIWAGALDAIGAPYVVQIVALMALCWFMLGIIAVWARLPKPGRRL